MADNRSPFHNGCTCSAQKRPANKHLALPLSKRPVSEGSRGRAGSRGEWRRVATGAQGHVGDIEGQPEKNAEVSRIAGRIDR